MEFAISSAKPHLPGDTEVVLKKKSGIAPKIATKLKAIVGSENYFDSDFERARHGIGRFYMEILHARLGIVENPPDVVVCPRTQEEVLQIVKLCNEWKIPIIPFAGNSSVTKDLRAPKGGKGEPVLKHGQPRGQRTGRSGSTRRPGRRRLDQGSSNPSKAYQCEM